MVVVDHPSQAYVEQEIGPSQGEAHDSKHSGWLCSPIFRGSEFVRNYIFIIVRRRLYGSSNFGTSRTPATSYNSRYC